MIKYEKEGDIPDERVREVFGEEIETAIDRAENYHLKEVYISPGMTEKPPFDREEAERDALDLYRGILFHALKAQEKSSD